MGGLVFLPVNKLAMSVTTNNAIKAINNHSAAHANVPASPLNPNMAATIASKKNVIDHPSIMTSFHSLIILYSGLIIY